MYSITRELGARIPITFVFFKVERRHDDNDDDDDDGMRMGVPFRKEREVNATSII